jgi:hypothetical protein
MLDMNRKPRRILSILLAAVAVNVLFGAFWLLAARFLSSPLTLVLWAASDLAILIAVIVVTVRADSVTGGNPTLRVTVRPVPKYLKESPGSPFILTFILSLIVAAATYSSNPSFANDLVTNTFLLLIVGIVLQAIALARKGSQEEN